MRCIVIDPYQHSIYEHSIPMAADFMRTIANMIGAKALGLDVVPPHTAMFIDVIGFLRDGQAFWRPRAAEGPQNNVAGIGIMFGLAPDGKLADLPPSITFETVGADILWVDDVIENIVERMQIVDFPTGKAPAIHRNFVWRAGAAYSAAVAKPTALPPAGPVDEAGVYSQGSPPAPAAPIPATRAAAKAPEGAPAPSLASIWAIHETADNRYRVIEYEVTAAGLGAPLNLTTVANIDEARARIPKGLMMRPADDDVEDDTLVETWS